MLQVTEPEPGVLKAIAVGDEGLVARMQVRERSPYERTNAEYEIALWRDGRRQNPVHASCWSDVLPKVCELMSLHAMRGKTGFPVPQQRRPASAPAEALRAHVRSIPGTPAGADRIDQYTRPRKNSVTENATGVGHAMLM